MVTENVLSKKEQTEIREQIQNLKADMGAIKDDLNSLVSELVHEGKHRASDARERIENTVAHAASATTDAGRCAVDSIEREIQHRPFTCLGLAALTGLVAGAFVLRGKD